MMSRRSERSFLIAVFLLSLAFRLRGIMWGLPYPYDFCGFLIASHAVKFFDGSFNPGWFEYPSGHMYFLFFVYKLIYWIGNIGGHFNSPHQFRALLDIDPSIFIISGRVVAALLGSGSVILCYILAKRLFSQKVAFFSLLLAILPMEVLNSHYTTADIPLTFWLLLAFIFCARIMEKPDWRYYILAGFFTGLAGGTKYPGLGIILTITTAHWLRLYNSEKRWRPILFSKQHYKLIIAFAVTGLAFFISAPYVFLDYQHSLPNLIGVFKVRYNTDIFDIYQRENASTMFIYVKGAFLNFGFLFTSLGLLGLAMKIKKITQPEILLLSWIVLFGAAIQSSALRFVHYLLGLSPFLLIFFAKAIICLQDRFEKKFAWGKYAAVAIALVIPLQPLYHSIKNDIILIKPDTREKAHDWIIKNIREGTVIAKEKLWTPYLPKDRYKIVYDGWSLGDHEMAWYKEQKVEYFLVSEGMKDLLSCPDRPSPLHRQFYKDLEKESRLIYKVSPKDQGLFMKFHNTTVLIYKPKDRF